MAERLVDHSMDTAGLKTIRAMRAQDNLSKQCVIKGNNSQVPYCKDQHLIAGVYQSLNPLTHTDVMWALKKWLNLVLGMVGMSRPSIDRVFRANNKCSYDNKRRLGHDCSSLS